ILTLLSLLLVTAILRAETTATNKAEVVLAEQVLHLLESRDVNRFANELCASAIDWAGAGRISPASKPWNPGQEEALVQKSIIEREKRLIAQSAQRVVDLANKLGVDTNHVHFRLKQISATRAGTIEIHGAKFQSAGQITIILLGEPVGN